MFVERIQARQSIVLLSPLGMLPELGDGRRGDFELPGDGLDAWVRSGKGPHRSKLDDPQRPDQNRSVAQPCIVDRNWRKTTVAAAGLHELVTPIADAGVASSSPLVSMRLGRQVGVLCGEHLLTTSSSATPS